MIQLEFPAPVLEILPLENQEVILLPLLEFLPMLCLSFSHAEDSFRCPVNNVVPTLRFQSGRDRALVGRRGEQGLTTPCSVWSIRI